MAQPPFKVDVLQIEPGTGSSRLIRRKADGSLEFVDPSQPGGLTLTALASLNLSQMLIVGAGAGAQYATIQAALDAVPDTSSPALPHVVLIGPGVYAENVVLQKDAVTLLGYGAAIRVVAGDALTISAGLATTPRQARIVGIELTASAGLALDAEITSGGKGLALENCTAEAVRFTGDGEVSVLGSSLGNITLLDTVALEVRSSARGAVVGAGTTSLKEDAQQGVAVFNAADHVDVLFEAPQADTNYIVSVERVDLFQPSAKTSAGFTLTSTAGVVTENVRWAVLRGPAN